jgi:flagellar motor switch/type III secretory pathway protein FliN
MPTQTPSMTASVASVASIPPGGPAAVVPGSASGLPAGSTAVTAVTAHTAAGSGDSDGLPDGSALCLAPSLARLPVGLEVMVPVREFRVRHLLAMAAGEVIETRWANGEDLPLSSGDVQLAWSEFEVVDGRLAVRVTRLA